MKSRLLAGAVALCLCVAAPASAQFVTASGGARSLTAPTPGFTYFNRVGATLADQQADIETCQPAVLAMSQPIQSTGAGAQYGLVGALTAAVIESGMQQQAQRRALHPHYENCMVMRGWRVVRLSDARGAELDALDQAALAAQLDLLVGAETPEGEIVRVFHNEVAGASTVLNGFPPAVEASSLSLQALPPESSAYIPPPGRTAQQRAQTRRRPGSGPQTRAEYEERRALIEEQRGITREEQQARRDAFERGYAELAGPGEPARALRERDIARLSDDETLLIVRVAGTAYGSGVILMRPGAEENTVDFVQAVVPTAWISGPKESTVIARVPPGRWRLSGFTALGGYVTSLCMGAPTFDIAAGDVVFAGSFAFGGDQPRLDRALEPAQAALAAAPNVAARVRAAEYRNGDTFECGAASGFYGYEIADAPFLDAYRFGSRVNYTPPAVAADAALQPAPAPLP